MDRMNQQTQNELDDLLSRAEQIVNRNCSTRPQEHQTSLENGNVTNPTIIPIYSENEVGDADNNAQWAANR